MGNKSIRIKYNQETSDSILKIKIDQDYDFLEVLSLKIKQEDAYKLYMSDYGVLVGRVLANDGFGIPNAKVSIFIKNESKDTSKSKNIIYPYDFLSSKNSSDVRYNLLPSEKVSRCHQNVGSFPSKRNVLDNNVMIEVFDDYYKYTTVTNQSGDYMIFGLPVGQQQLHVDIDLSDIGNLSQAPRDMIYKGYDIKQFDSPNKFKKSTNLDSLSQIISENSSVYIYPFWGDPNEGEIAISRKNINIQYKFEPTCIFIGSIFSDSLKGGISKSCKPVKAAGKMNEMVASQGSIEMIRKTSTGSIEKFSINGDRQINENGVWCYQIPMNLDYVITDEYGNIVPTDDPTKGIPTRTDVRFRITLDDNGDDFIQNKTGVYLVPNNPENYLEEDYEFSENTKDESFVTLLWNKVYSVKNYIPRLQKGNNSKKRYFNGIKSTNYHEDKNPTPYNNLWVDLNLRFVLLCFITKFIISAARLINDIMHIVDDIPGVKVPFSHLAISTGMLGECDIIKEVLERDYYIPISKPTNADSAPYKATIKAHAGETLAFEGRDFLDGTYYYYDNIMSCIETTLSSEIEVVNFDFTNDWLNGSLYAPRYRVKVKKNKKNGKKNEIYCGSSSNYNNFNLIQTCAVSIKKDGTYPYGSNSNKLCYKDGKCYQKESHISVKKGVIVKDDNNSVYYYRSVLFDNHIPKYYMPTGVILLGSLNDCDIDGIPQLHQLLPQTSFKLPPDSFEEDEDFPNVQEDSPANEKLTSGIDWGNHDDHKENGLFVAIGCLSSTTIIKSCVNASRLCEVGVDFDEKHDTSYGDIITTKYIDGFISTDEVSDGDVRGMFSTLNINNLKTKIDQTSNNQVKYDFSYCYPNFFDGRLKVTGYTNSIANGLSNDYYGDNNARNDYYRFRFGLLDNTSIGEDYSSDYSFPKYKNSFYFYFGIKPGQTALDLFNTQYFVPCTETELISNFNVSISIKKPGICLTGNGALSISCSKGVFPYRIYVNNNLAFYDVTTEEPQVLSGLTSQYYNIKVIDGNENVVNRSVFLPISDGISYEYDVQARSKNNIDGKITIFNIDNPNSPDGNYHYLLTGNGYYNEGISALKNLEFNNLDTGNYILTLHENGCNKNSGTTEITVFELASVELTSASLTANEVITAYGSVTNNGNSKLTDYGFCFGTGLTPTISDDSVSLSYNIPDIPFSYYTTLDVEFGKTYYIRAYALNEAGYSYSDNIVKIVAILKPFVSIPKTPIRDINDYSVSNIFGYVSESSNYGYTDKYGFIYMSEQDYYTGNYVLMPGLPNVFQIEFTGETPTKGFEFTGVTTGLNDNGYIVKAYATNSYYTDPADYFYSLANYIPSVPIKIKSLTELTPKSLLLTGIINTGIQVENIYQRGFCYSTGETPTVYDRRTVEDILNINAFGDFSHTITGLTPNLTYNIRAYARNSSGVVAYSRPSGHTMPVGSTYSMSTKVVTGKTNYLITGGYFTEGDYSNITSKGVIVSESNIPTKDTVNKIVTVDTTGTSEYNSFIMYSSIDAYVNYYIRAYAVQNGVTGYADNIVQYSHTLEMSVGAGDAYWLRLQDNSYVLRISNNTIASGSNYASAVEYGVVMLMNTYYYQDSDVNISNGMAVNDSNLSPEGFQGDFTQTYYYEPNYVDYLNGYYYKAYAIDKFQNVTYSPIYYIGPTQYI